MKCHFNVVSSIYTAAPLLIFKKCICSFFLKKTIYFPILNYFLFTEAIICTYYIAEHGVMKMWMSWFRKYSVKKILFIHFIVNDICEIGLHPLNQMQRFDWNSSIQACAMCMVHSYLLIVFLTPSAYGCHNNDWLLISTYIFVLFFNMHNIWYWTAALTCMT